MKVIAIGRGMQFLRFPHIHGFHISRGGSEKELLWIKGDTYSQEFTYWAQATKNVRELSKFLDHCSLWDFDKFSTSFSEVGCQNLRGPGAHFGMPLKAKEHLWNQWTGLLFPLRDTIPLLGSLRSHGRLFMCANVRGGRKATLFISGFVLCNADIIYDQNYLYFMSSL